MGGAHSLLRFQRVGIGLSFIVFPLVFVFAFAGHPGLLEPHFLGPRELIERARGNGVLHFGHALVTLNTGLLIVVALHFVKVLEHESAAWLGFIGGSLAVLGALMLAADKGALCLTMSALENVADREFDLMMPGLLAMYSKKGWMVLIWGLLLLPIGFLLQAIALIRSQVIPRWQSILFLVGVIFIGTPDGAEIINTAASVLMAIALIPYGLKLVNSKTQSERIA